MATKKNDSTSTHTEIRIGITESDQELNIESELTFDKVQTLVSDSLKTDSPLILTDVHGKQTIIPAKRIAFIELGELKERKVGFAAN